MKTTAALLLFFISFSISAQNIEVIGGVLYNSFYDTEADEPTRNSLLDSHFGHSFTIGIDDVNLKWLPLRFTIGYENYGGKIDVIEHTRMSFESIKSDINNKVFTVAAYLINFKILKKIDLNIGLQYAYLLNKRTEINYTYHTSGWNPFTEDINDKSEYCEENTYGLRGRVAYDFTVYDRFTISPQYDFYYGLSKEFRGFPETVYAYRHYFSVGLQIKVGK